MRKLFDRIVEVVDEHADRTIRTIENILLFIFFLFIFAFFIHLAATAISEGGNHVNVQGHSDANPQSEKLERSRSNPDLDRPGIQIQFIND